MPLPRIFLILLVKLLRFLANTLAPLILHYIYHSPPHPPATRTLLIPTTLLPSNPGTLTLHIYHPRGLRTPPPRRNPLLLPCILNFHGGGFTLGNPTDDALWCHTVSTLQTCIVISASYRLAPEHPFPTAPHDACDALLYVFSHAAELGVDAANIVVSGFSAGGTLCFAMPLLWAELKASGAGAGVVREDWNVKGIMAWYPGLDRTISREEKRMRMRDPDLSLPAWLTTIFDASYQPEYLNVDQKHRLLSPGVQSREVLEGALPRKIRMVNCEHDLLCKEAEDFVQRLGAWGWGVELECVMGVRHGWDKFPGAKPDPREFYARAGEWLRREVWGGDEGEEEGEVDH
ncbi:hypothetical protein DSL72_002762 [Monilinia vaccinii-corymbosi]|uniref:Alpha/beta hydrolase fold-3 domain-containing protein n=1 Tax=Monilinia vaccinii-corymbosi TaxID=61207 RepID=A0A8A3PDN7_9HELO|nr:hypothetical protein DSL72_002762 [Monilinia vaccinii-corymbosi]